MANIVRESIGDETSGDLAIKVTADVGEALTGFKALQRELRETAKAARELERAYMDSEQAINSGKIAAINDMRDVQGVDGNWDVSDYMCGLYNGLELASASLEGRTPEYRTCKPADINRAITDDITRSYE